MVGEIDGSNESRCSAFFRLPFGTLVLFATRLLWPPPAVYTPLRTDKNFLRGDPTVVVVRLRVILSARRLDTHPVAHRKKYDYRL